MDQIWKEYQYLYELYEGYGDQLIQLKGWSVTVGLAALIAAYSKPVSGNERNGRIAILIAALSAIPFWLTETFWKQFQTANLLRLERLEECVAVGVDTCVPMQAITTWREAYHAGKVENWFQVAFDPHVLMPHAALFVFGVVLFLFWPPKQSNLGQESG